MVNYDNAYWEDYYGQDTSEFDTLSYLKRDNSRVFTSIEKDIEAQIRELRRTIGSNVVVRLYRTTN